MTTKGMLGMHHLVMLNEAQRSEASILVSSLSLGMTTKGMLGITPPCHAEQRSVVKHP